MATPATSNPYACYDRRYFVELIPAVIALAVAMIIAFAVPRSPATRLIMAGLACGAAAWVIVITVAAIRRLDEMQRHIQLVAIAIAFAATGVVAVMERFFHLLGVTKYPTGFGLWIFMSIAWTVSLLVLYRRYR